MEEPEVVEHFFGVYLLYCMNEKYKGRTYIGYTVDPNRRLKQHNKGAKFGGAYKTSNRGPWKMVLIVHGFPNSTSALMFEWAWQHPTYSRRLKHVKPRKKGQKVFEHCLLVLSELLNVGPWYRMPLTVRFFEDDFYVKYVSSLSPPMHMPITHGPVISKKLTGNKKKKARSENEAKAENLKPQPGPSRDNCLLCHLPIEADDKITCVQPGCLLVAHILCLGKSFWKDDGMLLPVDGICPSCNTNVLWGDLVRKMIGCNLHLTEDSKNIEIKPSEDYILVLDSDSDFED